MEDDLNILANGRWPQYFGKWKTTLIFCQMEDDLNILAKWNMISIFRKWKRKWKMEDDIRFFKLEDELILFLIGR